jgi:predicted O-methyltransferase YrrM
MLVINVQAKKVKLTIKNLFLLFLKPYFRFKSFSFHITQKELLQKPNAIDIVRAKAAESSAVYISENIQSGQLFSDRLRLWDLASQHVSRGGLFLEFGVSRGKSINYFASQLDTSIKMFGFDSFEGLKEGFAGTEWTKGAFTTNGKIPKLDSRITVIKGWFEQTLPIFAKKLDSPISIIHIDSDTYESTNFVLKELEVFLSAGTLILFDEYHGHPNWENCEFKAWQECVLRNNIEYKYLGFAPHAALVQIKSKTS